MFTACVSSRVSYCAQMPSIIIVVYSICRVE